MVLMRYYGLWSSDIYSAYRFFFAIAFGIIGGPLAYWGASRGFDAVAFTMPLQATLTLAIGWGIAMGVLTAIARRRHTSIAHQSGASA